MSKPGKQAEDSFERRWSSEVAQVGFYQKPKCFSQCLSELGLTIQEVAVLDVLFSYAFNSDELPTSYPSTTTIGDALGMAYSTVGTHIRKLEGKGFIKREYQNGTSNLYKLGGSITIIRRHIMSKHPPRFRGDTRLITRIQPYSNTRSKEEALKKNKYKKSKLTPINEILATRYGQQKRNDV